MKVKVKSHCDIFIGEFPFHKKLKEDLVPLLEEYDDRQNRTTNVQATMTEWEWDPPVPRLKRLKECIMEDIHSYSDCKCTGNEFPLTLRFHNFLETFIGKEIILSSIITYHFITVWFIF